MLLSAVHWKTGDHSYREIHDPDGRCVRCGGRYSPTIALMHTNTYTHNYTSSYTYSYVICYVHTYLYICIYDYVCIYVLSTKKLTIIDKQKHS